ncbi:pyruvate kinase-like [Venturia canescens]|uniref:pyruvate kinase-like n=1 Tax=Venturia canescens TaxID=32260 RepID=UPI001C9BF46F|nr:pyruvate kinase-like [Venturia canescens]
MACKNNLNRNSVEGCPGMPWMMKFEEECLASNQLNAAYQSTNIDHMMRLNVESPSKPWRLTKIIITLGDKNSNAAAISRIINAGANVLRLNMSHKDKDWHCDTVGAIREAQKSLKNQKIPNNTNVAVALAVDLRGPEIRTGFFNGDSKCRGRAVFTEGDAVTLLTDERSKRAGDSTAFWISCSELPAICEKGDRIMLDRGTVGLQVSRIDKCSIECIVTKGGTVSDGKSLEPIDTALALPDISEQDDSDIEFATNSESDFIVVSHVRRGETILKVKDRIKLADTRPICILGKISSKQALDSIDDVLRQADGIIIDRRSLELGVGAEKLFLVEKSIVAKCNRVGKPVIIGFNIVAGENDREPKLDSSLIANAVLEGIDGIFLATGFLNVEETVNLLQSVKLVCREAENARWQRQIFQELSYKASIPLEPSHSIAISAVQLSLKCNASGIIVITTTGRTAMMLSIYRPRCPIVAVTRYGIVARWLQLYFAVHPLHYIGCPIEDWRKDMDQRIQSGMKYLRTNNYVEAGEPVVIVSGWRCSSGFTNCIRVVYASPRFVPNTSQDFEEIW